MTSPIKPSVLRTRLHAPRCVALVFAVAVAVVAAAPARAPAGDSEPPSPAGAAASLPTAEIVPDVPANPPVPPNDPAVQARLPGCAVWTDRCVTCERAAGRISCSNIGISCQPQAVECVRSEAADEKKQGE
jgi:hypothetical protein